MATETSVLRPEQAIPEAEQITRTEGRGMESRLRRRLDSLEKATNEVDTLRAAFLRLHGKSPVRRMHELIENADDDRPPSEAASWPKRSDIRKLSSLTHTSLTFANFWTSGVKWARSWITVYRTKSRSHTLSPSFRCAWRSPSYYELGLLMKSEIEQSVRGTNLEEHPIHHLTLRLGAQNHSRQ